MGKAWKSPTSFADDLKGFDDADIRKIMRDNALDLLGANVTSAA